MINLWDYYSADRVSIRTKKGKTYIGQVLTVWPAEDIDENEDEIDIELKNGEIWGFGVSEIESIMELK